MHQSIPPAPRSPPPPGLLRGICLPSKSLGGAFANFALPGSWKFANPRAIPELSTQAVSYQNMTPRKVVLEEKQIGLSVKDRNKL